MSRIYNAQLTKDVEERGYRSKADRRISEGRVIAVDATNQTCTLDVGVYDTQGNRILLQGVPFQPQNRPNVNDPVFIDYANVSPHSMRLGGTVSGGANLGAFNTPNAVNSLRSNANPLLVGNVVLADGTGIDLTQSGQTITVVNTGITSFKKTGSTALTGDFELDAGTGITLTQSTSPNKIAIACSVSTSGLLQGRTVLTYSGAGPYNLPANDLGDTLLIVDSSGTLGVDINLPALSGRSPTKYTIKVRRGIPATVTVKRAGTDTIDGVNQYVLNAPNEVVSVIPDSVEWNVV